MTFTRPPKDVSTGTPFVVVKDGGDRVNVTRLGGDAGRYWRVSRGALVGRDLAWLKDAL